MTFISARSSSSAARRRTSALRAERTRRRAAASRSAVRTASLSERPSARTISSAAAAASSRRTWIERGTWATVAQHVLRSSATCPSRGVLSHTGELRESSDTVHNAPGDFQVHRGHRACVAALALQKSPMQAALRERPKGYRRVTPRARRGTRPRSPQRRCRTRRRARPAIRSGQTGRRPERWSGSQARSRRMPMRGSPIENRHDGQAVLGGGKKGLEVRTAGRSPAKRLGAASRRQSSADGKRTRSLDPPCSLETGTLRNDSAEAAPHRVPETAGKGRRSRGVPRAGGRTASPSSSASERGASRRRHSSSRAKHGAAEDEPVE